MLSTQDLIRLLASTTSEIDDSYKSIQEYIELIARCIEQDAETGDLYIRVKDINS